MAVACNEAVSDLVPTAPAAEQGSGAAVSTQSTAGPNAPVAAVKCEKQVPPRSPRSKISVDGNNLAPGRYRARVTSPPGSNPVVSRPRQAVGDEVELDFDSNVDPGETPIPADFIKIVPGGPDVQGEILTVEGAIVASQSVECQVR
jgi:hypothetical protein